MLIKNEDSIEDYGIIWGYCLLLSIIFLLICTKSSPLYPFNDWIDSNAFFTMGKGMMNGKVLYRDLFEQKGPLLYLIHGISYLISNTSFFGVYIFEVISFSTFLFYSHKLISLFLDIKYSIISLPLITAIILNMTSFSHGDSAEEFCLSLITISLYFLINYFINIYPKPVNNKWLLLNGIIAGCVLWIKFSLLGFWFGWMASMFLCMIINKNYLSAVKGSLTFLVGMLLSTLPWIIYFGFNNSIAPWLDTYILININSYAMSMGLLKRVIFILGQIIINIGRNPICGPLCVVGVSTFLLSKRYIKNSLNRICFLCCVLLLFFGLYGSGRGYIYYFLIFSPFVIFGFIVLLDFISKEIATALTYKISVIAAVISLIITLPLTLLFNHNTYMLKIDKKDLVQYKFASIIQQSEHATLLNYGTLDIGLFTTTGITPNIRFFELQNIDYSRFPLNMDEQNRYIKDKEIEYVVVLQSAAEKLTDIPNLFNNYKLIEEDTQVYEGIKFNYSLLKRLD